MTDIFEETEETLRTQKWIDLAKKAAPWASLVLGGALVLSLGAWGLQSYNLSVIHKASENYQTALEAFESGDKAKAKTDFTKVSETGSGAYKSMAFMQLAGLALEEKKTDEAIALMEKAAKATSEPAIHDLAVLKLAYLKMDKAPVADIEKILKPIIGENRPFTYLAREALAMAKLQAGDTAGAKSEFTALSLTLGAPQGVKQSAQARIAAIEAGSDKLAREVIKLPEAPMPAMPEPQGDPTLMMPQQ